MNFKNGVTLIKHYCINSNCNNEIDYTTFLRGSRLCASCSSKKRFKNKENHPCFGIKRPDVSKRMKTQTKDLKIRKKISETRLRKGLGKGKKNGRYIDNRTNKKYYCKDCGDEISARSGFYGEGRCQSCAGKRLKVTEETKRKISLGLGGTGIPYENAKYGAEFNNELKEQIRERDNHQCQLCDVKQEDYYRKLDVHHIDYNKKNCDEYNLITLCNKCNTEVNFDRDYWFAYFTYIMENRK